MPHDPDLLRAARHMIARHGSRAADAAARRAEALRLDGDDDAAELWRQIARVVRELQDPSAR
jgi:hypothetical protein